MAPLSLTPGFRFHPTDVELIKYYLKRKLMGAKFCFEAISELNIYKFSPWDLQDKSCLQSKDRKWYFFCPRERKYASGSRASRSTEEGYWKATGKDRAVLYNKQTVGMVKTLIFHLGRAPKAERTDWVMHEYRSEDAALAESGVTQDAYVLCKIFKKSGPGPKNGAEYGAPFIEEDWSDHEEETQAPDKQDDSVRTNTSVPGPSNAVPAEEASQLLPDDDDLNSSLATFVGDDDLLPIVNYNAVQDVSALTSILVPGSISLSEAGPSNAVASEEASQLLPDDDDLSSLLAMIGEDGDSFSDAAFMELNDLDHFLN